VVVQTGYLHNYMFGQSQREQVIVKISENPVRYQSVSYRQRLGHKNNSRPDAHCLKHVKIKTKLNSSVFWVITRRKFKADVSGLPIDPIFKGQTVQGESLIFEDGSDR
jgi:hypothetical protein